jgi:hypothetical protein
VAQFFSLTRSQMVVRYCSLHPEVSAATLNSVLRHVPKHFKWAGCDLFVCGPRRRTVVVETNSCPSGQKSLPFRDGDEHNGYGRLMRTAFRSLLPQAVAEAGGAAGGAAAGEGSVYAVIYDKNEMEARGYAGALADITGEPVHLAEFYLTDPDPPLRWSAGGHLSVRTPTGAWLPVKAALRYVTQKPWTRMPVVPATPLLNPLLPCLAGGRNKMLAARAYSALNDRLAAASTPLRLLTPHTLGDISKERVPELVAAMGGCAVVKVPYGNAGQGVYTITCASELAAFMAETHGYDKFIVQQLVGGRLWGAGGSAAAASAEGSSSAAAAAAVEKAYHLGTVPSTKGHTYVFDLRMMVCADEGGFKPCSMYARRAAAPLGERSPGEMEGAGVEQGVAAAAAAASEAGSKGSRSHCSSIGSVAEAGAAVGGSAPAAAAAASGKSASASWQQLGTNLSVLTGDLTWSTESERLVMMDARDFQVLGLGLDDLIDGEQKGKTLEWPCAPPLHTHTHIPSLTHSLTPPPTHLL